MPQLKRGRPATPLKKRLLAHVDKKGPMPPAGSLADGRGRCWLWRGTLSRKGYGLISVGRVSGGYSVRFAHRVAYEVFVGPIPSGLEINHLCHNKSCVCPTHLEPVTKAENLRRRFPPAERHWGGEVPEASAAKQEAAQSAPSTQESAAAVQAILGDRFCPMRALALDGRWVHCVKEPGHSGGHVLLTEAPMVAEIYLNAGVWIDKSKQVVRPKDGNWQNADPNNWEIVTRRQHIREALARPDNRYKRGERWNATMSRWERECRKCLSIFPSEENPGRAVCRECRLEQVRKRGKNRYWSADFSFNGQTFRLGSLGEPPTEAEFSDAIHLLMALLDQQFRSESRGDPSKITASWAAVVGSLSE